MTSRTPPNKPSWIISISYQKNPRFRWNSKDRSGISPRPCTAAMRSQESGSPQMLSSQKRRPMRFRRSTQRNRDVLDSEYSRGTLDRGSARKLWIPPEVRRGADSGAWLLSGEREILEFYGSDLARLERSWDVSLGERFRQLTRNLLRIAPTADFSDEPNIRMGGGDWLTFSVRYLSEGGHEIPANEIQRLLRGGGSEYAPPRWEKGDPTTASRAPSSMRCSRL